MLERILNKVGVLQVVTGRDKVVRTDFCVLSLEGKEILEESITKEVVVEEFFKKKIKIPVIVRITGEGVLRKVVEKEDPGIERILSNEELLWDRKELSEDKEVLAFTRKKIVEEVCKTLEKLHVPLAEIKVGDLFLWRGVEDDNLEEEEKLKLLGNEYFSCFLTWKRLFSPDKTGSRLAMLLADKIKLLLLVLLLLLLVINYFSHSSINDRFARQQYELYQLEQSASGFSRTTKEVEELIAGFNKSGKISFAPILDRIASVVPERVKLEYMAVSPLGKAIEEGKNPVLRENTIEIEGEAPEQTEVTRFTGALTKTAIAKEVRLIRLERDRDSGKFHFKIVMVL